MVFKIESKHDDFAVVVNNLIDAMPYATLRKF